MHQIDLPNIEQNVWIKVNNESRETFNANSQTNFKTLMLKSSLCG